MNYQRDLNQLNNLYAQVEQLKSLQAGANYRTVFTDISNE